MSRKPPIPLPKRGAATKGAPGAFERALAFLRQGNLPQAHALCERIISAQPRHALAWHLLGAIELQRGEPALALRRFDSALAIETGDAGMHNSRGNALVRLQRYEEALASLDRCLALQPRHAEAQHTRGGVLFRLARYEEALAAFEGALAIEPGSVMTWNSHGSALVRLGRREAARESFRRAAELAPHHPLAHYNLGCVLGELGQREAAVACFERAVALEPRHAEAHNNLGVALAALGRCEAALVSHDAAVRLKPDVPENQLNRGVTLERLGRHAEARECYEAAVARAPDNARAHWNLALNCLLTGDFARGWEHFEWRWRYRRADEPCAQRPRWTGAEPLAGKTILLVAEQGLGDTLQFCRYAALLAERGASVVLCVPHPLVALLATLPGAPRVLAEGDPLPDFDYCCPMMSLPRAFGTTLASIPGEVPYLSADPDKCAAWAARIGPREGLRAGLVWSGGLRADQPDTWEVNRRRNVPLEQLAELKLPGVSFFSLQKGDDAVAQLKALEAASWRGPRIADHTAALADFSDTAAFVHNLDLVVSIDTSTAHLAAAMGKEVWLLNRHDTCWRWLLERSDSPWYPTLRQFRQPTPGDWTSVIADARAALQKKLAGD